MPKINLDAIIPREDFEVDEVINSGKKKETVSIEDIKSDSFFFSNIRKPDFQRETNEWDESKVCALIKSFVDGDLIPAVILWRNSGGYIFVIDGSHRLSALAAWVNDDYGDGIISKGFYDGVIPDDQIRAATLTRRLIDKEIGSYESFKLALSRPDKVKPEIVKQSKGLGAIAVQLQWVEGDAKKAESSFFKINQQAAQIDKTELKLLENRRKPNSIAARAIIRSGKGHKYWSSFEASIQTQIQEIASAIHKTIFTPALENPIKTLDIPIAGKSYAAQTQPMLLDMINIIQSPDGVADDSDGKSTLKVLKSVQKIANLINSNNPESLGLHPAVYFYSQEGRHKNASFLATACFVGKLRLEKKLQKFIKIRAKFEEFLLSYDYLIQQINRKYRTAQNSYSHIANFYEFVMDGFLEEKDAASIISDIRKSQEFKHLLINDEEMMPDNEMTKGEFTTAKKSQVFIATALKSATKCAICNGYIHKNSISIDHKVRRREGGKGTAKNGQLSHPFCNTGIKS